MRMASRSFTYSLLYWLIVAIAPHGYAQSYQGKELVKAELLADTTAIVPGKPFTVGLLLRMAPGGAPTGNFPATQDCPRN